MNTLLLVGGDLCERTAQQLDPAHWRCIGLRRSKVEAAQDNRISWRTADLLNPASLSFLGAEEFSAVTHILYAPSPDSRTIDHYTGVYSLGLPRLLNSLPPACLKQLQRCVLVGSSAVWAPSEEWVDENTPVQQTTFRASALLEAEAALHGSLPPGTGIALRLSGLYGPGRLQLMKGLQAGTITAPDGPGHWANRIHIDDAARACAHLLTLANPQPLYIGTDDCPMPTVQFYDELAKLIGAPAPAGQLRAPSGKRLSNARLRASGWEPAWPNALKWYAEQQS